MERSRAPLQSWTHRLLNAAFSAFSLTLSLKGSEWDADVSFQPKPEGYEGRCHRASLSLRSWSREGGQNVSAFTSFVCQLLSLALSILGSQREMLIYGQCALDQRSCCQRAPFYFNATKEFLPSPLKHSHIFLKFAPFFFKAGFLW